MLNQHRLMSINLRHARTFVTVADLGTVSKAAAQLRIAQPALSRQIGALEQELGLKLFDRVGSRLVLTGEGEQLLGDCRVLLNYANTVGERAQLLQGGDTGVLKVASSPQVIEGVLSGFLSEFAGRSNVQVETGQSAGLAGNRRHARARRNSPRAKPDASGSTRRPTLRDASAGARRPAGGSAPEMLIGESETMEIARLAPYPLLLLDGSFVFRRNFDAACRLAGFTPNIRFESRGPTLCWRWPSVDMASPSSRQLCGPTVTRCGSSA